MNTRNMDQYQPFQVFQNDNRCQLCGFAQLSTAIDFCKTRAAREHCDVTFEVERGDHRSMYFARGERDDVIERSVAVRSGETLRALLVSLSREHGGAWAYFVLPFSNCVIFQRFAYPSVVPDRLRDGMGMSGWRMGYRGQLVPFTPAAVVREQQRGQRCDR